MEMIRRRFRADLAQRRIVTGPAIEDKHLNIARQLLADFGVLNGLRTLDAIQLASALDLKRIGEIQILVASNRRLCQASKLAGCEALNPEEPEISPIRG